MLRDTDVERLFVELCIPDAGRALVRDARKNSPVRDANSRLGNSIVWQFSQKMGGHHLELESRTVEAVAATTYEDDCNCLEYWPQPFRVDLIIKNDEGRTSSRKLHTPDFLIIRNDGIFVHEWREESRLLRLANEGCQFYKDENSNWHYRAAEEYFTAVGLKYELHSAVEHPRTYIQNIRFLQDYQSPKSSALTKETESELLQLISTRGSMPFLELANDHGFKADDIFKAISMRLLVVDLYSDRLDATSTLMVHRDMAVAKTYRLINNDSSTHLPFPGMARLSCGAKLNYNGKEYEVILVGGVEALLKDRENAKISLPIQDIESLFAKGDITIISPEPAHRPNNISLASLSKEQLELAHAKLDAINGNVSANITQRTLQRWRQQVIGSTNNLDKLLALASLNSAKGNRCHRISEQVELLAEEAIRRFFNTPEGRTATAVYQKYQLACEESGLEPMSYPTFTKRVKEKKSIKLREGKRKAYQVSEIPLQMDYSNHVHGVRPHEVCYVDHTIMNIATIGPDGTELGKPTFTLAVDGHTTQARAFYLSYDPPSKYVVLMTLRDYVRRHNRLPRILSVDGGKEFRSWELEQFCKLYEIDLRHRPAGMPRGGTMIERAIGATETELLAQLVGNTRIMKNARMVTKSVNPFPNATWTITALHGALDEYLFEIREHRSHPKLGMTPHDFELKRLSETGLREHLLVKFDQDLMLMTSPHAKRPFHKIDPIRGVWTDNMHYWHDDFRTAQKGDEVEVRIEPWNANIVYVYFRNRWIAAIARDLRPFAGRTQREVEIAIRTERRLAKANGNKDRLSKMSAKKMVGLWSPSKFDERIGKQQKEMEHLYASLGMTTAMHAESLVSQSLNKPPSQKLTPELESVLKSVAFQSIHTKPSSEQDQEIEDSSDASFWGDTDAFI